MRFAVTVGIAALAAGANGSLFGRQADSSPTSAAGGGNQSPTSTPASTSPPTSSSPSSTPTSDSTVISTVFVTGSASARSTVTSTVSSTKHTTLTSTSTAYTTTTVTSSNQQTATKTVWETTTVQINNKRGLYEVTATPTAAPALDLAKRAVQTQFTTVTVAPSGGGVVTVTATDDVVTTDVVTTTVTSTDTETDYANAKTTTTVTSTRTVSAVIVSQTVGTSSGAATSTSSPSTGKKSDGGLSTGAKAGIGAGVGVAGLLLILGAIFFCYRRRNRSPKADPDMMAGASEVPVGPSNGTRPMSHASSGAFRGAAARTPTKLAPEGYRGTAMGDGRAGYAKPDYGSSYGPSRSTTTTVPPNRNSGGNGPDSLPEHPVPGSENATMLSTGPMHGGSPAVSNVSPSPSKQEVVPPPHHFAQELGTDNSAASKWRNDGAAEIDSQPVMGHQSGPVYEMPTENYR